MKKAQQAQRRQSRHDRQVARRIEKKKQLAAVAEVPDGDEELDLEEGDELGDPIPPQEITETEDPAAEDEPEEVDLLPVRKDYGGDMGSPMMSMGGPTSFAELDEQETAQEQAQAVREETWNVQDLVRNIMSSQMLDTAGKSAAIQAVGSDFGDRVNAIMKGNAPADGDDGGDMADMQKDLDLDLLYTEALIATDRRHMTWQEGMADWFTKAKLSYAAKQAKPDSSYALVYTTTGKSGKKIKVRKYLLSDKAHVRNALARAAQQIKGGGVGAPDARRALPKIHAAAKRMGIGMGKSSDFSAILVEKDQKGDWRWVGRASNNFIDWSGDIVRKSAHEEYAKFFKSHPDAAPMFMSWHTPGTERVNPVDFCEFIDGFQVMSGKLTEAEAAALLKAQTLTDLGMSVNGIAVHPKSNPHDIQLYRLVEVSDLPLENADNPFTAFEVLTKEVDMDKTQYLAAILGSPEKAEAFIKKNGLMKEQLEQAGVTSKSKDPDPEPEPKPAAKVVAAVSKAAPEVQTIVDQVFKELDVEGLNAFVTKAQEAMEKVPVLEQIIKDMQGNADEKLAEKISPPATRLAWATKQRASDSQETLIEKDSELAKRTPALGDNWLSQATGTRPIDTSVIPQ